MANWLIGQSHRTRFPANFLLQFFGAWWAQRPDDLSGEELKQQIDIMSFLSVKTCLIHQHLSTFINSFTHSKSSFPGHFQVFRLPIKARSHLQSPPRRHLHVIFPGGFSNGLWMVELCWTANGGRYQERWKNYHGWWFPAVSVPSLCWMHSFPVGRITPLSGVA